MSNWVLTFRRVAVAEGISFIVLLLIAMPLKYFLGIPEAVKVVGWIHGVLFVMYGVVLAIVHFAARWSILFSAWAFFLSLIPVGTFYLDWQLRKKERAA